MGGVEGLDNEVWCVRSVDKSCIGFEMHRLCIFVPVREVVHSCAAQCKLGIDLVVGHSIRVDVRRIAIVNLLLVGACVFVVCWD